MSSPVKMRALGAAFALTAALSVAPFAGPVLADGNGKIMKEGGSAMVGDIMLTGAWTRATPPRARAGGGYLTVKNNGAEADRLVSGKSDVAKRTEIHEMAIVNDVMKMRKLDDGVEIPAGGTLQLKPGSYHVMFIGLKDGLVEGTVVDVTLTFQKAGDVAIKMPVAKVGAKSLTGEAGMAMDHSKMDHGNMDHSKMDHGKMDGSSKQ